MPKKKVIKNKECTDIPGIYKGSDGKYYYYDRHSQTYKYYGDKL